MRLAEDTVRKKIAILAPSHNFVGLSASQLWRASTVGKKLLNNDTSSTCLQNVVYFGLTAEILGEFGTPLQLSTAFASWQLGWLVFGFNVTVS